MKLKADLENEGVELSPKVGAGCIGRSVGKKGKREGVKGRVCEESVGVLGVAKEVKS